MHSTGNGVEAFSLSDGGSTPFRGKKATNWEAGYRVPVLIRWLGTIKPRSVYNDVFAHKDMLSTILAALGVPDVTEFPPRQKPASFTLGQVLEKLTEAAGSTR
jgi:arylsulfatase